MERDRPLAGVNVDKQAVPNLSTHPSATSGPALASRALSDVFVPLLPRPLSCPPTRPAPAPLT